MSIYTRTVYTEIDYKGFTIKARNIIGITMYSVDEKGVTCDSHNLDGVKDEIDNYLANRDFYDCLECDDSDWGDDSD